MINNEMSIKEVIELLQYETDNDPFNGTPYRQKVQWAMNRAIELLKSYQEWIPIKTRSLTDEEKESGLDYPYIYDCQLPEDGETVLITTRYDNVTIDTFCRDAEGCYFETYCDDGDVKAWMSFPDPWKEDANV